MSILFAGGGQSDTDSDTATGIESYEYVGDSEFDDRSYIGAGMASARDRDDTRRDSEDCSRLSQAGMIEWVSREMASWLHRLRTPPSGPMTVGALTRVLMAPIPHRRFRLKI